MNPAVFKQAHFLIDPAIEDLPDSFGIVTACNPDGVEVGSAENLRLDRELGSLLSSSDVKHFRVTGGSRDMTHAEPGYGCLVDRERIVELGRKWNQEAVFWVEGDNLFLIPCATRQEFELLGSFRERVIGV